MEQFYNENGYHSHWLCKICSKMGKYKNDIKRHVEIHFRNEQICGICGKVVKNRPTLRSHLKQFHNLSVNVNKVNC